MDTFTRCPVCMVEAGGGLCSPECADWFDDITESWEPSDLRLFSTDAGAFLLDLSGFRIRRIALPDHPSPAMRLEGEWHEFVDCTVPKLGKPFRITWKFRHVAGKAIPHVSRSTPVVFVASCVICGNPNVAHHMGDHECEFEEE